jgi:hypothetical protein
MTAISKVATYGEYKNGQLVGKDNAEEKKANNETAFTFKADRGTGTDKGQVAGREVTVENTDGANHTFLRREMARSAIRDGEHDGTIDKDEAAKLRNPNDGKNGSKDLDAAAQKLEYHQAIVDKCDEKIKEAKAQGGGGGAKGAQIWQERKEEAIRNVEAAKPAVEAEADKYMKRVNDARADNTGSRGTEIAAVEEATGYKKGDEADEKLADTSNKAAPKKEETAKIGGAYASAQTYTDAAKKSGQLTAAEISSNGLDKELTATKDLQVTANTDKVAATAAEKKLSPFVAEGTNTKDNPEYMKAKGEAETASTKSIASQAAADKAAASYQESVHELSTNTGRGSATDGATTFAPEQKTKTTPTKEEVAADSKDVTTGKKDPIVVSQPKETQSSKPNVPSSAPAPVSSDPATPASSNPATTSASGSTTPTTAGTEAANFMKDWMAAYPTGKDAIAGFTPEIWAKIGAIGLSLANPSPSSVGSDFSAASSDSSGVDPTAIYLKALENQQNVKY